MSGSIENAEALNEPVPVPEALPVPEPVERNARHIQTYFGERFGTVSYDRYRNLEGENEFDYIKSKILFAFFGPPVAIQAVEAPQLDSNLHRDPAQQIDPPRGEYTPEQNAQITPIYEKIYECRRFSPQGNNVCMSVLYACVVPYDKSKSLEEHADILSSNIQVVPLFKVRKCIRTDVNDPRLPCSIYIDDQCRVYTNWKNYLENNKLVKGVMVVPKDGRYQFSNNPSMVLLETCFSPQSSTFTRVTETLDTASLVTGLASMGVFAASMAIPVAGPILVGAALTSTSVGTYGLFSSGRILADRYNHDQSISIFDSQARGCWLNVVGSSVGIISAGASQALAMAARNGAVVSQGFQHLVDITIFASIGTNACGISNGVYTMFSNYSQDGTVPSKLEIIQLTSSIFFFCHSTMTCRTASTIIEETQNSTLNQQRDGLRSNRHRKMFDKMAAETRRQAGGTQQGNAEIIRSMQHINNKDDFFASAIRMNKEFNANKVKVSFATDGSMNLNAGNAINPVELINLNPAERAEFLGNVNRLNLSARNYSTVPIPTEFSSDFSYTSVVLLVNIFQSQTNLSQFIIEHIADFIQDNLNRLAKVVKCLIDDLPPVLKELLESNTHTFEFAFKFAYEKIKLLLNCEGIENFTDALSSYFVNGEIDRNQIVLLLGLFMSHINAQFESQMGSNNCNVCGGIIYGN